MGLKPRKIMDATEALSVLAYSSTELPLKFGNFRLIVYRNNLDEKETVVLLQGAPFQKDQPVFVRLHSECLTGEVLSSLKCDCKMQLEGALTTIAERSCGVLIYLRQEGRGIGLGEKIRAYELQNQGFDTVRANEALGFPPDLREFQMASLILKDLGIDSIELNTNNPQKIQAMKDAGIKVCSVIPSLSGINPFNQTYLQTKFSKLGHHLGALFDKDEMKDVKKKT